MAAVANHRYHAGGEGVRPLFSRQKRRQTPATVEEIGWTPIHLRLRLRVKRFFSCRLRLFPELLLTYFFVVFIYSMVACSFSVGFWFEERCDDAKIFVSAACVGFSGCTI
jgi:hypothetical protein